MTKLALTIIDKISHIDENRKFLFTRIEVLLLIFLSRLQNDDGSVFGVHYKDVIMQLGISPTSFYDALKSLEIKNIIKIDWNSKHGYYDLRILNNDYSNGDYSKNPYLNTNHLILHSPAFYNLSLSQIIFILRIIRIMNFGSRKERNNYISLRLETIMGWVGKSRRSVLKMIKKMSSIKHFLSFEVEGNNVFIPLDYNKFRLNEHSPRKEADIKTFHALKHVLRKTKNKGLFVGDDIMNMAKDICGLIRQYKVKDFR